MDFDEYVAARYGRLIEHAVLLGCAEGEAGTYVDQVLLDQRKQIRRAEDPDPLVREALERAIAGTPDRSSRTGPLVALGLVLLAVAVGMALTYRPAPEPMPNLFALNGDQAEQLLRSEGHDVLVRPARSCEPPGLVVGSDPPSGGQVQKGATVTIRTSVLSGSHCEPQYPARSAAWEFVRFALGGEAPKFADTVRLLVSGSMPRTFLGAEVADRERWGEAFDLITDAAHQTASTASGMPVLRAEMTVPPAVWCGVPRPTETGEGRALRFQILTRVTGDPDGCPLTVDLYRSGSVIDTVVVYTSKAESTLAVVRLVPGRPAVVQRFERIWQDDGPQPRPHQDHHRLAGSDAGMTPPDTN
jgi:hypothetical protein